MQGVYIVYRFTSFISERELTFKFAICYRQSVCRLSVCRLKRSWTLLRRLHYSRQYFYGIRNLGHPLTSTENFMLIVPGNPFGVRVKSKGVAKYSDFGPMGGYISEKCKIGGKLVLITNRKSHMSFRLVPNSVTLNDLGRRNGRYFASFQRNR